MIGPDKLIPYWWLENSETPIVSSFTRYPIIDGLFVYIYTEAWNSFEPDFVTELIPAPVNPPVRTDVYKRQIPGWDKIRTKRPSETPVFLDHGYDESKPKSEWDIEDMRKAAEFRGGKCLSPAMTKGDLSTPLDWECQFGHRFKASPTLVLLGGHWCPECLPLPWNYD